MLFDEDSHFQLPEPYTKMSPSMVRCSPLHQQIGIDKQEEYHYHVIQNYIAELIPNIIFYESLEP